MNSQGALTSVVASYRKQQSNAPMELADTLRLKAGYGILGDVNANSWSPRQVLLADEQVYKSHGLAATSLRENLLICGLNLTRLTSGQLLQVGKKVILRVTIPCESGKKLTRVREGLARQIANDRGVLARVIRGRASRKGDPIRILERKLPPIPTRIPERLHKLLALVPYGKVVTYSQLTVAIGVPKVYVRVLPRMLRSAPADLPTHRVVSSNGILIDAHIPQQRQILQEEGVVIGPKGCVKQQFIMQNDPYRVEERPPRLESHVSEVEKLAYVVAL
jgi:alkylated DNA nucleotide flippase Atl1